MKKQSILIAALLMMGTAVFAQDKKETGKEGTKKHEAAIKKEDKKDVKGEAPAKGMAPAPAKGAAPVKENTKKDEQTKKGEHAGDKKDKPAKN